MSSDEAIDLNGKRILLVEDEFVLALAMAKELEELGATVIGPAPTAFYALQLMGLTKARKIDAAVLDVHLHRANVFEVADKLKERGVPFLFATGYGRNALPARFAGVLVLPKPVSSDVLSTAIMKIVHMPAPRPALPSLPSVSRSDEPPVTVFARVLARTLMGEYPPGTENKEPRRRV